ncbi:MAG: nucleoside phosphorylase [Bacteroidales bacterium]|nr:nucleoside phosphorylase [Bacteroidales bacterium]
MKRTLQSSELILNPDNSIYHLHLLPHQISDTIILVGDPNRVDLIAQFFNKIEFKILNREFYTITGYFNDYRITALSTGIGTDNIDIVINELDALVNIDFNKKEIKENLTSLNLIRLGTSGGLQENITVDSFLVTEKAIGFDGLLNFYADNVKITDSDFEKALVKHLNWYYRLPLPYVVDASNELYNKLKGNNLSGVTISAPGFYGPQGRILRLSPIDPEINNKITNFEYNGYKITNYEMESSALYGLSKLLGHKALTICVIIANRITKTFSANYKESVKKLIEYTLHKLTESE